MNDERGSLFYEARFSRGSWSASWEGEVKVSKRFRGWGNQDVEFLSQTFPDTYIFERPSVIGAVSTSGNKRIIPTTGRENSCVVAPTAIPLLRDSRAIPGQASLTAFVKNPDNDFNKAFFAVSVHIAHLAEGPASADILERSIYAGIQASLAEFEDQVGVQVFKGDLFDLVFNKYREEIADVVRNLAGELAWRFEFYR